MPKYAMLFWGELNGRGNSYCRLLRNSSSFVVMLSIPASTFSFVFFCLSLSFPWVLLSFYFTTSFTLLHCSFLRSPLPLSLLSSLSIPPPPIALLHSPFPFSDTPQSPFLSHPLHTPFLSLTPFLSSRFLPLISFPHSSLFLTPFLFSPPLRLKVSGETQVVAKVTYQNLFRLFPRLSGMTGN